MKKNEDGTLTFSPTDLIQFAASPFASWMERYYLESPGIVQPDEDSEDAKLIVRIANEHERSVLEKMRTSTESLAEISSNAVDAEAATRAAISENCHAIYQAVLNSGSFAGVADFLMLSNSNRYQVWDTKLARSPKPQYAIQLCCYSEMLSAMTGTVMPEKFGIILGTQDRIEFRIEDFIHYYRHIKARFLAMQNGFSGTPEDRPEPLAHADHGHWSGAAQDYFEETDHLVRVAGITVGQIKKLRAAGITTMTALAGASATPVPKLAADTRKKLAAQADLQRKTLADRKNNPDAKAHYEVLPSADGAAAGLAALPADRDADVFFDMEGYPLVPGGLEYLFGVCTRSDGSDAAYPFHAWWAHDRNEEKAAFEGFIDWVFDRWRKNPGMHIYHYAPYEVSAIRRLSTRHDTRQQEVDDLLRNGVFVDLYQIVRHGLRIGEDSYSIKKVERLYRNQRGTSVASAVDSIVQYANWMASGEPRDMERSTILTAIRDYNRDDCASTAELLAWMRDVAKEHGIAPVQTMATEPTETREPPPDAVTRLETAEHLRAKNDPVSTVLADIIDFHRREEKPIWWRLFDRNDNLTDDELRDDPGCIAGVIATSEPTPEKQSLVQVYTFDPNQECKLSARDGAGVWFKGRLDAKVTLTTLDTAAGSLSVKIGKKGLNDKFEGSFPQRGSLLPDEHVPATAIQTALTEVIIQSLTGTLHPPVAALLNRTAPASTIRNPNESTTDAAIRITTAMSSGCLVIQGPPGTGKTYTASRVINALVATGKRVGVSSNSRKAVANLLAACDTAATEAGTGIQCLMVGAEPDAALTASNPHIIQVAKNAEGFGQYSGGVVGGTAWLFCRPEWIGQLDFLFIDEAGQVSLANTVAMSRCANNLVLLGDQMQLEQPIQGSHPGDSGLSALQYALKDITASVPDSPVLHAVVPSDYGLFLGESRRMHPSVCAFISESIYERRLTAHPDCAHQRIAVPAHTNGLIAVESGIVFSGVEHDGNVQQSPEEVDRVVEICNELIGRRFTDKAGTVRRLELQDILFIAPYNAQVRALQSRLPAGARVGSVDRFQGQEAPVCILSFCSSYGEYGSRGLGFILNRNRVNVAISRAQCLAVVVADPRIAGATAGSLEEMTLINLFCKLAAAATEPAPQ